MLRTKPLVFVGGLLSLSLAQGVVTSECVAHTMTNGVVRVAGRSITAGAPELSPRQVRGLIGAKVEVVLANTSAHSVDAARSDFVLSAGGDMFSVRRWNAARPRVAIAPKQSRRFRLTFSLPSAAVREAALSYRPSRGDISVVVPLNRPLGGATAVTSSLAAQPPTINTFWLTGGVGDPWGTAVDGVGNIWFAEPGCDFNPSCAAGTPPGQIGELNRSTGAVRFYTLPTIPGNQPIFVAFDGSGNLWFTTPNNSMIGEFSPASGTFVGQWPVTSGSGPWDLTVAGGRIWYTEHLVSAVGSFDPSTHSHQDFGTPSANSNPYGIAATGSSVWFTENNSSVDRIGVIHTDTGAISEYPIVQPLGNSTPHLISLDPNGHPWWTEGWSDTIATLNPAAATPGSCGTPSGTCNGVARFTVPASATCGGSAHTSGIAFQGSADRVWLDNSLTNQVGSFDPTNDTFAMRTLGCGAHPHDGLNLDSAGDVWYDDEFQNALGELIAARDLGSQTGPPAPVNSPLPPPINTPVPPPINTSASAPVNTSPPTIVGSPRQAQTLTANGGSWTNSPSRVSYQWQSCTRGCADIAGATAHTYKLTAGDIGARVRAIVVASNAEGSTQANSNELGPIGPSLERVTAAVEKLLAATRNQAMIKGLLTSRGVTAEFAAPSAGRLTISWSAVPARSSAQAASANERGPQIAAASLRVAKAGAARLTIRLTKLGKRLLEHSSAVKVVEKATFSPAGEAAVTVLRRFRLSASSTPSAPSR